MPPDERRRGSVLEIEIVDLEQCAAATGTVVVVDVLRAFTAAAFVLAAGAREIRPVATAHEAFRARRDDPDVLLMGEVEGLPVAGFDLDNSPVGLDRVDVSGRVVVHRTSAGTQGLVRSATAERLVAASFVTASATAALLDRLRPARVTFVATGRDPQRDGDEDLACCEYLVALLRGARLHPRPYLARVATSTAGRRFADPADVDYPARDLGYAVALDRFDRVLLARRRGSALVLTAEPPRPARRGVRRRGR